MGLPAGARPVVVDLARELGFMHRMTGPLLNSGHWDDSGTMPNGDDTEPAAKARRRRGSKEAKQPDHAKDDAWWLPTNICIDLGGLVKVPKDACVATAAVTA
jgi:hypothetical protein